MKTNNLTIISLLNILNNYADKKLPQKISFAITKNIMAIEKEYKVYEKQLQKIVLMYDKYIEKNEDGNINMDDSGIPKIKDKEQSINFKKEIDELLSIEIEFNLFTIDEDIFNYDDDRYSSLTPVEIMQLHSILCIKDQ